MHLFFINMTKNSFTFSPDQLQGSSCWPEYLGRNWEKDKEVRPTAEDMAHVGLTDPRSGCSQWPRAVELHAPLPPS